MHRRGHAVSELQYLCVRNAQAHDVLDDQRNAGLAKGLCAKREALLLIEPVHVDDDAQSLVATVRRSDDALDQVVKPMVVEHARFARDFGKVSGGFG